MIFTHGFQYDDATGIAVHVLKKLCGPITVRYASTIHLIHLEASKDHKRSLQLKYPPGEAQ